MAKESIKTSAFCRSAERLWPRWCGDSGFTLVEMLVVLVVVAALTAFAVPATARLAASFRLASERQQVERQLRELPLTMRQAGRDGLLTEGEAPPAMIRLSLDLPKDWSLQTDRPIRYHFTGACDGGEVVLSRFSEHWHYQLTPPLCRPRQIDAERR